MQLAVDTSNRETCDFGNEPLSCPSSTGSFSSSASSLFSPFTPRSGRSTPQEHAQMVDLDSSFASTITCVFDFTPPASANSSGFFPPECHKPILSTPSHHSMLDHAMPVSSPAYHQLLDSSMALHAGLDMTPSQQLDTFHLTTPMDSSSFGLLTPVEPWHQQHARSTSLGSQSIWHQDNSPVTFMDTPVSPSLMVKLVSSSRPSSTMPKPLVPSSQKTVHRTSNALQKAQQTSPFSTQSSSTIGSSPPSMTRQRLRKARRSVQLQKAQCLKANGILVNTEDQKRHPCEYPGCDRMYKRKEHMKRHLKSHDETVYFDCDFCDPPKRIRDRGDNFKTHLQLHLKQGGTSRTKFRPAAQDRIDELERHSKSFGSGTTNSHACHSHGGGRRGRRRTVRSTSTAFSSGSGKHSRGPSTQALMDDESFYVTATAVMADGKQQGFASDSLAEMDLNIPQHHSIPVSSSVSIDLTAEPSPAIMAGSFRMEDFELNGPLAAIKREVGGSGTASPRMFDTPVKAEPF